jgi:hypothetical protein
MEKRNTAKEKKKRNKGYPYKNKKIRDKKMGDLGSPKTILPPL